MRPGEFGHNARSATSRFSLAGSSFSNSLFFSLSLLIFYSFGYNDAKNIKIGWKAARTDHSAKILGCVRNQRCYSEADGGSAVERVQNLCASCINFDHSSSNRENATFVNCLKERSANVVVSLPGFLGPWRLDPDAKCFFLRTFCPSVVTETGILRACGRLGVRAGLDLWTIT
jgi:hypothetical protein